MWTAPLNPRGFTEITRRLEGLEALHKYSIAVGRSRLEGTKDSTLSAYFIECVFRCITSLIMGHTSIGGHHQSADEWRAFRPWMQQKGNLQIQPRLRAKQQGQLGTLSDIP